VVRVFVSNGRAGETKPAGGGCRERAGEIRHSIAWEYRVGLAESESLKPRVFGPSSLCLFEPPIEVGVAFFPKNPQSLNGSRL
jgi:hypothetical protein